MSLKILAAVEAKMGNYYQTVVLAEEVLASHPNDDTMLQLRESASEQLQKQAVAVTERTAPRPQEP